MTGKDAKIGAIVHLNHSGTVRDGEPVRLMTVVGIEARGPDMVPSGNLTAAWHNDDGTPMHSQYPIGALRLVEDPE